MTISSWIIYNEKYEPHGQIKMVHFLTPPPPLSSQCSRFNRNIREIALDDRLLITNWKFRRDIIIVICHLAQVPYWVGDAWKGLINMYFLLFVQKLEKFWDLHIVLTKMQYKLSKKSILFGHRWNPISSRGHMDHNIKHRYFRNCTLPLYIYHMYHNIRHV